jgi:fucose permease
MSKSTAAPTTYPGGLNRRQIVAWRNAIFGIFAMCGIGMATWVSRIPSVRDAFAADTFTVGILAFAIAIGSILGLVASSHIISRLGAARTILIMLIIAAVGVFGAAIAAAIDTPNFAITALGLAVFGAAFGICDVAMNVSGAAQERAQGKPIMPIFHAFFSFGTMAGAGIAVIAELLQLSIAAHVGIIAVLIALTGALSVRYLQSELVVEENAEGEATEHSTTWRERLAIWKDPRTLLIGLVVLGMAFAEGSANDWLALAVVDGHKVANSEGAFIFGIFVTAMTVGRLAGVKVLERFGRVPVLRATAILAAVGLLILIYGPNPVVATIGVVLWGLGASLGFPVGMSAAADDPKTAAARVSAVATIGYFAFLVGPPLIGLLGQYFGLLNGLLAVLALVALAGLASGAAREPKSTVA